ncbi:hypothetical protein [Candidatus Cryosericum terrychapinii]|jgi:hypothetical protein|uniref:Uncharacterized protein n=1 Tax=Candidatus Cryosericum terrychapinii TaxID=2290919 RepID=A0A398CQ68_9BACT|nr:hypothetical protein [Candidatus Cryosericum terrychapinii]RIE05526.1 hypothetical protein SMC7_06875 [Candidatus Cryosericum terrychapinii]
MYGTAASEISVENTPLFEDVGGDNVHLDLVDDAGHMVVQGDGSGPKDQSYRTAIPTFLAGVH